MGNDKAGAALHKLLHGFLDQHLGTGIDRRRGLVQNQNAGIGQERPGNGHQLLLALRNVRGIVVDYGVIAVGQGLDKVIHIGHL